MRKKIPSLLSITSLLAALLVSVSIGTASAPKAQAAWNSSVPRSVSCTTNSSSQITVSWAVGSSPPSPTYTYEVTRSSTSNGTYSAIGTTLSSVFTYANTSLSASTKYYYKVRYKKSGSSYTSSSSVNCTTSAALTARTLSFGSPTPSFTLAIGGATGTVTATPSASDGAVTYSTSDAAKCTVSSSGVITPVAAGSCSISASIAASSTHATASTTSSVSVTVVTAAATPTISSQPVSISKTAGQSASFSVTATCLHACLYQWKKDAVDISGGTSSTYSIATTATSHAGTYTVAVTDSIAITGGYSTASQTSSGAVLTMSSALTITTPTGASLSATTGQEMTVNVVASGGAAGSDTFTASAALPNGLTLNSTTGVITGLLASNATGNYDLTVTVTDANGKTATTSSFRLAITKATSAPTAPTGVSLSTTGLASDGRVKLSWTLNTGDIPTGGSPITKYEYRYALESNMTWSAWTQTSDTSTADVQITGLSKSAVYVAQVRASNSIGPSEASATTNAIAATGTSATLLSAPTDVAVTAGNQTLVVTFTAPISPNAESNLTLIQYSTDNGVTWSSSGGTTSPFTISGLTNGTTYQVKLRSINAAVGTPTASLLATGTAKPSSTPGAPSNLVLTSGSNAINATFTAAADSGGLAVTYEYQYKVTSGGSYPSEWTSIGSDTSFSITGLTNDRSYTVQIRTRNANGTSSTLTPVAIDITSAGAPTITVQPVGLSLTTGMTTFTLEVTATATLGATLTYQWKLGGTNISGATSRTYAPTVSGGVSVSSGHSGNYTCTVTATINGTAASTTTSTAVVTVAATPTISTTTLSDATATSAYTTTLAITSSTGVAPFTWALSGGTTLPAGLTLSSAGVISGTPTTAVINSAFSVVATDANAKSTTVKNLTLTVNTQIGISTLTLSAGTPLGSYSQTLVAVGGSGAKSWQLATGSVLPAGLSMSTSGVISGTVGASAVTKSFTAQVTDAAGAIATKVLTITIASGVPGAPTSLSKGTISSGAVLLTWSAPVDPGSSPISQYYINYSASHGESDDDEDEHDDTGSVAVSASSLTFPYKLSGLKNGRTYTITISARNASLTGPASASVSAAIGTAPGAPKSVSLSLEDGKLKIRWKATDSSGGFKNSSYDVECQASTGGSWINIAGTRSDEEHGEHGEDKETSVGATSSELTIGTTYKCHVRGNSAAGSSSWTESTSSLKFSTVPSAITTASADIATKGKAIVSWDRNTSSNANGGLTIMSYIATLRNSSESESDHEHDSDHKSCSVSRTGSSWDSLTSYTCTIEGVPTKGSFKIYIYAVNSLGQSVAKIVTATIVGATQTLTIPKFTKTFSKTINGVTTTDGDNALAQKKVGDPDFVIGATISSGLRAKYASTTPLICSVKESKSVRIIAVGTCAITISQTGKSDDDEGESDYEPLAGVNGVSFDVVAIKPAIPSITSVVSGNTQLVVNYAAPTGSGGAPTSYDIQSSTDATTWLPTPTPLNSTSLTATLTGLNNGTAYYVRILAKNTGGSSAWVQASGTYTPYTVPSKPTITSVTATAATSSAAILWSAPNANGASITGYTVTASLAGVSAGTCTAGAAGTTCSITGLLNKNTYSFKLVARNAGGSSADSDAVTALILGLVQTITKSDAPTGIVSGDPDLQIVGSTSSGLAIQYASLTSGVCTVSSSGLVHYISDGSCKITLDQDGVGTKYSAATQAIVLFSIAPELPTAPTISTVTNGVTGLTIIWTAPSRKGSGDITYLVTAVPASGSNVTCTVVNTLTCVLTGLTKGTEYTISVTAANAKGTGAASATRKGTWFVVPTAPAITSAAANGTDGRAIDVGWNKTTNDGGSVVIRYEVTATADGQTSRICTVSYTSASTFTCAISSLKAGVQYSVTAIAVNAAGNSLASSASLVTPGKTQTITVASPTSPVAKNFGDSDFRISSSVSSGRTPIYTSNNTSYCTVSSSGLVHIVSVSTCLVSITEPGSTTDDDNEYKAATPVTVTINISAVKPGKALITAISSDSTTVTVTWADPAFTGGAAITPTVTATPTATCTVESGAGNTCTFTGLTNGTTYTIVVTETNSAGATASDSKTAKPFAPAGEPSSLMASPGLTNTNAHEIALTWVAPTGGAGTLDYYIIYNGTTDATLFTTSDTSTSLAITTYGSGGSVLTTATAYLFKIAAHYSDAVTGPKSPAVSVTTLNVPGKPVSVAANAGYTTSPSVVLSWSEPDTDGGDQISTYTATATSAGHTTKTCTSSASADLSAPTTCTIDALDAGVTYSISITATNGVGTGLASDAITKATVTTPGASSTPVATQSDSEGSATITWTKSSDDGGSAIINYTVTAYLAGAAQSLKCVVAQSSLADTSGYSCKITGLSYKTAYTFRVKASNLAGSGTASADSNAITLSLAQVITLADLSDADFPVGTKSLSGSTDSGLGITYTSNTSGVCTVSGAVVQFVKVGTCSISAAQAGDSRYNAATTVTKTFVVNAVAPDAVTLMQVAPGASQLSATWSTATNFGGSTHTGYEVVWATRIDFSDQMSQTVSTSTTTYVMTGLIAKTLYYVRVRVLVSDFPAGSAWSNTLQATTFGLPAAPVITGGTTGVTSPAPQTALVEWIDVPTGSNGGTPITGYQAEAFLPSGSSSGKTCTSSTTSCTITGLSGAVTYSFKATSINAVGSATSAAYATTLKPGASQAISATNTTVKHALRSFSLSATASSGLPLQYSAVDKTFTFGAITGRTVCTINDTGTVTVDVAGTCEITLNQNGNDGAGNTTSYLAATEVKITITVEASDPSSTRDLSITSGDKHLDTSWAAPSDDGGAAIEFYTVTWYKVGTTPTDLNSSSWYSSPTDHTKDPLYGRIKYTEAEIKTGSTYATDLVRLVNGDTYTIISQAINKAALIGPEN
ncbi:MAG: fibronectin type III domain-containing protein [Actinomycetes bacterium]